MKRRWRFLALLLALCLCLPAQALAASMGDPVLGNEAELARGVDLADGVYWGGSDFRDENYLIYTPSQEIYPVVVYGSKLCNYGNFRSMAQLLENEGYHVIGGINGDYYDTATYCPLGIVIRDGELISSDAGHYAVGFLADGRAIAGSPALTMTLNLGGEAFPLASVNKTRDPQQFALFTEDFSYTTKNNSSGRDVVLSIVEGGSLTVDCQLTLQVEEIVNSNGAMDLPAGKLVLSLSGEADSWRQSGVDCLQPGDTVTLTIQCADSRWSQVRQATGALYQLISGGVVQSGLPGGSEPRTAIGIRADGSSILYTIDGRQSGYSSGASMSQVAQRLAELGCVEACLLDGGGSTSLNALYIGDEDTTLINQPSGGSIRSVTSYIMLVTREAPSAATRLGLTPLSLYVLTGASTELSAGAADDYGWAATLPALNWSVTGSVGNVNEQGYFQAGPSAAEGSVVISAPGLKDGVTQVQVLETPHSLTVKNEASGATVSSLQLASGDIVDLTAIAGYYNQTLVSQDDCFSWYVSGNIGRIDANGRFQAGQQDGQGSITVQAGDCSVEIPVAVGWRSPFDDIDQSDWYFQEIKYVYQNNLFSGQTSSHFGEDVGMTRAMFVTVLWRMLGEPAGGATVFPDVAAGSYYSDAVNWAAAAGIISGYEDGRFQPEKTINREEICLLLYNFANWAGISLEGNGSVDFRDDGDISSWARAAVETCVRAGLVNGESNPDGSLTMSPKKTISRAHAAVLLARFHQSYFS